MRRPRLPAPTSLPPSGVPRPSPLTPRPGVCEVGQSLNCSCPPPYIGVHCLSRFFAFVAHCTSWGSATAEAVDVTYLRSRSSANCNPGQRENQRAQTRAPHTILVSFRLASTIQLAKKIINNKDVETRNLKRFLAKGESRGVRRLFYCDFVTHGAPWSVWCVWGHRFHQVSRRWRLRTANPPFGPARSIDETWHCDTDRRAVEALMQSIFLEGKHWCDYVALVGRPLVLRRIVSTWSGARRFVPQQL